MCGNWLWEPQETNTESYTERGDKGICSNKNKTKLLGKKKNKKLNETDEQSTQ